MKNKEGYEFRIDKRGRTIFLHRELMEHKLGRKLKKYEQVHHKNGVRDDNRLENLQVISKTAHATLHRAFREQKRVKDKRKRKYAIRKCPVCGEAFARYKRDLKATSTCSRSCSGKLRFDTG